MSINQNRNINILNLAKQYTSIKKPIEQKIIEIIRSQKFILGKETEKFERAFSKYCGKKYTVTLTSGTEALYAALYILGIKRGDEVIVPVFTFIATAEVVSLLGGKVVFCDIDPHTGLIDHQDLQKKITAKTKFIIPVHIYGQISPMKYIIDIVGKRDIKIIEDAAQAHGASFKGKKSPIKTIAAYSFYPSKNLGAFGDAGALVTNENKLYEKLLMFRNHGQKKNTKYHHHSIGFNLRMNEIQAAALNIKLKYLNRWNSKRQKIANLYNKHLKQIAGLELMETLPNNVHVYHQYAIKTKKRNSLKHFLDNNGVESRVHYPIPLHLQPAYKFLKHNRGDFIGAETLAKSVLCLPIYPELTKREILYIIQTIQAFFNK